MNSVDADAPTAPAAADGRATRWADHRESRRAELVRAARRTVHQHGPLVSMEEIAVAAGTSKSIVYRYFADKTALKLAVAELVVRDIEAALTDASAAAGDALGALTAMVEGYLGIIERSPNVYAFTSSAGSFETGGPLARVVDDVIGMLADTFARAGAPAPAAALWGAGAYGFVLAAGERWMSHRDALDALDRSQAARLITSWLWSGVPWDAAVSSGAARPCPAGDAARLTTLPG